MGSYTVGVAQATHDDLKAGIVCSRYTRVRVLASDDVDAVLTACAIAHSTAGGDFLPTGADLLDFPV